MPDEVKKFCEFCNSRGVKHEKTCTRVAPVATPKQGEEEDKFIKLEEKFDALVEMVGRLAEKVLSKEDPNVPVVLSATPKQETKDEETQLVPRAWRNVVTATLGEDFGLNVKDSANGNFTIEVIVPPQWDRRVGEEKEKNRPDISTGLVRSSSAIADVEKWCTLIKQTIKKSHPNFK